MTQSDEDMQSSTHSEAQPPLRGFAAKMTDYAAKYKALGRAPSPPPPLRSIVLISSKDGIVASAERLQELAELSETPRVFGVPFATREEIRDGAPDGLPDTVCISDILLSDLSTIQKKADMGRFDQRRHAWYDGRWLNVTAVLGAKRVLIS